MWQKLAGLTMQFSRQILNGPQVFFYFIFLLQWDPCPAFLSYNNLSVATKDFRATQVRCLTAATAAVTLAFLFVEMLCYVMGRLHSSCVLCTKIGLLRWELINKTLLNDIFSNFLKKFLLIYVLKFNSSENFSFQSYHNKNL
jgi:hypothetical protein